MKFCDKLAKIRRSNNISQEQLADSLGVSRQAVSKWENGTSRPDMEKIISMCKIFNCTLNEIMDDDTILADDKDNTKKSSILKKGLNYLVQFYNMFCDMSIKEKLSFILELLFIAVILTLTGIVIFIILNGVTSSLFSFLPPMIAYHLVEIIDQFYKIGLIIIGLIITSVLLKVRYLDYYISYSNKKSSNKIEPINNENEKEKKEISAEETKTNNDDNFIIRDPKYSSFNFLNYLKNTFIFILKIFSSLILFVLFVLLIIISTLIVIVLYNLLQGQIFVNIFISLIALLLFVTLLCRLIYSFILARKINYRLNLILFFISIFLSGIGLGLTFIEFTKFSKSDSLEKYFTEEETVYLDLPKGKDVSIYSYCNTEYLIDESLDDKARVVITYTKGLNHGIYNNSFNYNESSYYSIYIKDLDLLTYYDIIIDDLKNRKYHVFSSSSDFMKVKIYVNKENYEKLSNKGYYI